MRPEDRRGGFTLVEALVALTISTAVVMLASNLFLVQNDFYSFLLQRSRVQDNARAVLEVVGSEVQSVTRGGLVKAESHGMTLRVPHSMAAVCAQAGPDVFVQLSSPAGALDLSAASGLGGLDAAKGTWEFGEGDLAGSVTDVGAPSAAVCALAGADTVGATGAFARIVSPSAFTGLAHGVGDILMVYQEVEFLIDASTLDPNLLALYRGPAGGPLTEYATGLATDAAFQYWTPTGKGKWRDKLGKGLLDKAERVRIVASTFQPAESGVGTDASFSLTVDLPLRNR